MGHFTFHATSSTNYSYSPFLQPKFMQNAFTNFKRLTVRLKCFLLTALYYGSDTCSSWMVLLFHYWWMMPLFHYIQWCCIRLRISGIITISTTLCRTTGLALHDCKWWKLQRTVLYITFSNRPKRLDSNTATDFPCAKGTGSPVSHMMFISIVLVKGQNPNLCLKMRSAKHSG